MLSSALRRAFAASVVVLAVLVAPSAASAIILKSQITTPAANPSFPSGLGTGQITIAGTANFPEAEIWCYDGTEGENWISVAKNVKVTSGSFSVQVSVVQLPFVPCQLRAVPLGETEPRPPGEMEPFEGPIISASFLRVESPTSFSAASGGLPYSFRFEETGEFPIESSVYIPKLHEQTPVFWGNAGLWAKTPTTGEEKAGLTVDGANAYVPSAAVGLVSPTPSGAPQGEATAQLEEATHTAVFHITDEVDRCSPGGPSLEPVEAECKSFVSSGVKLEREYRTSSEDRVASMIERFTSTDGAAHTIKARYFNEMLAASTASYELPGSGSFVETKNKETDAFPQGAGALYYKYYAKAPEAGNEEDPFAALAYDLAPTEAVVFGRGSQEHEYNEFEMPYTRTVTPAAPAVLRMTFVQGMTLAEVRALSEAALAGFAPQIAITSPADKATISSATVTGTASDSGLLTGVTVNGVAAAVSGSTWSATIPVTLGANTITATATDGAGLTKSATETVTYLPTAKVAAAARAKGTSVSFSLKCSGPSGSCVVTATLSVVEHLKGGKIKGVAAKKKTKLVTVGSAKKTIAVGKTGKVTVKLNALGRKLLARFHKLPVRLSAVLTGGAAKKSIFAQTLTLKPVKKKKG